VLRSFQDELAVSAGSTVGTNSELILISNGARKFRELDTQRGEAWGSDSLPEYRFFVSSRDCLRVNLRDNYAFSSLVCAGGRSGNLCRPTSCVTSLNPTKSSRS
jgi:hypothetical protein